MSRWDPWDERPRPVKKPPPEHGIKLKKAGTTWWGQRWIEALEHVLSGDAGRLARGKTYARAGRAHDLVIEAGTVTAKVTGTRATPYAVRIALAQLSDETWQNAIARLAEKAQFAAELLAGQMPKPIDEVFQAVGASLFPAQRSELSTECSCPDWGDPCKHVAATHYLLGEAFDADPFLLFELRGRGRSEVLAGLRAARAAAPGTSLGTAPANAVAGGASPFDAGAPPEVPRVTLGVLSAEDYDRAPEPLPVLQFSFEPPAVHGALLRQLGAPSHWQAEATPAELLSPVVERAAEAARQLALGEPGEGSLQGATSAPASQAEPPTSRARATPGRGKKKARAPRKGR